MFHAKCAAVVMLILYTVMDISTASNATPTPQEDSDESMQQSSTRARVELRGQAVRLSKRGLPEQV